MYLTPDLIAKLNARFFQYALEATLPSSDGSLQALPQEQIQAGFHFWSEALTITFNTLVDDEGDVDSGVCDFSAQFKSGGNSIALSNDFLDLATIAVPGRQRSVGVTGDPSNGLHIPGFPWPYFYESSGSVMVDLRKAADGPDETARFVFTGFLIPVNVCPNAQAFYELLASVYPEFGAQG